MKSFFIILTTIITTTVFAQTRVIGGKFIRTDGSRVECGNRTGVECFLK